MVETKSVQGKKPSFNTSLQASNTPLQGSYSAQDCLFLLKPIKADYQTIDNKEKLIQSGQMHYSQMIHKESPPTSEYTELFYQMTARYKSRLAQEVMALAKLICQARVGDITLLSLARAGTPIGVLLQRALNQHFGRKSTHYSISIVRDRGVDDVALDYVLANGHTPESIVFIDGWTAKGVITRELHSAIRYYNKTRCTHVSDELFVVSDIGGTADVQATFDDYTIPSALMNSTVSGLISRSILNDQIGPNDFHGCVSYRHLKPYDVSVWFVDEIFSEMQKGVCANVPEESKIQRQKRTEDFLTSIQASYGITDINRIKPGIAEATRVLLRRVPDKLLVRKRGEEGTLHLERLALEKSVDVIEVPDMPFGACSLVKDVAKNSKD